MRTSPSAGSSWKLKDPQAHESWLHRDDYLRLVDQVRQAVPEISLTTDLIVGFPGETDQDFQDTLSLVRKWALIQPSPSSIHRGRYPCGEIADQIPEDLKKERIYELIELQNAISDAQMQKLVGSTQELLVEGHGKSGLVGRTRTNRQVYLEGQKTLSVPWFQLRLPRRALGVCKDEFFKGVESTVKLTPMMQQYYELKEQYPDSLLF